MFRKCHNAGVPWEVRSLGFISESRTKGRGCAYQQEAWVKLPVSAVHELGQLQDREGHKQEDKASRSDVVQCGDGVELDPPLLQQDLNQDQAG